MDCPFALNGGLNTCFACCSTFSCRDQQDEQSHLLGFSDRTPFRKFCCPEAVHHPRQTLGFPRLRRLLICFSNFPASNSADAHFAPVLQRRVTKIKGTILGPKPCFLKVRCASRNMLRRPSLLHRSQSPAALFGVHTWMICTTSSIALFDRLSPRSRHSDTSIPNSRVSGPSSIHLSYLLIITHEIVVWNNLLDDPVSARRRRAPVGASSGLLLLPQSVCTHFGPGSLKWESVPPIHLQSTVSKILILCRCVHTILVPSAFRTTRLTAVLPANADSARNFEMFSSPRVHAVTGRQDEDPKERAG